MYEKFKEYEITATFTRKGRKVSGIISAVFAKEDDNYYYFVVVSTGKEVRLKKGIQH